MRRLFRNHGLSLAMLGVFAVLLVGQFMAGLGECNRERAGMELPALQPGAYLFSPHFLEATAENWESEFLQMFVYVAATAFLYQTGSAESKDPRKKHTHHVEADRDIPRGAPWPVRRGGWVLRLYENSLSLAFLLLFPLCLALHLHGGLALYNEERASVGQLPLTTPEYFFSARFWFESLQNWQSEFLAIGSMVVLTIFLRQKNSPESKEVETPHWENEE